MLEQPEQTLQRPEVPWRLRDLGLAVAWVAAAAILTSIILAIIFIGPGSTTAPEGKTEPRDWMLPVALGSSLLLEAALLGSALWFGARRYGRGWDVLGFRWSLRGWWTPVAVLFGAYFVLGVYITIVELAGLTDLTPESTLPEDLFENPFTAPLVGVLALIAAPLAEETFFRGFLFPGLRNRFGTLRAAFASSLFFALLHFNVGSIVPFTLIGMLLVWAYVVSGSLWMGIAAHFAFNAISFFVTLAGA